MSRHSCPKCGNEVPRAQRYLRNYSWAKWNCTSCGPLLGFSQKSRNLVMLLNVVILVLIWILTRRLEVGFRWWTIGWLMVSTLVIIPLFDRIIVVDKTD